MNRIYAQILRENNMVGLIGGSEIGLPRENHRLVYCIDITDRVDRDNIELYMTYDEATDTFINVPRSYTLTLDDIKQDTLQLNNTTAVISDTTTMTSEDALLIMETQMALDEKLNAIISHLGL